jgi:hypothetical protein
VDRDFMGRRPPKWPDSPSRTGIQPWDKQAEATRRRWRWRWPSCLCLAQHIDFVAGLARQQTSHKETQGPGAG